METDPKVGLNPVTPHLVDGDIIEPKVSVPIANATRPAATAEADPADDPLEPWSISHGFLVFQPYHTSPLANDPDDSLHSIIAPAFSSFSITRAFSLIIWFL